MPKGIPNRKPPLDAEALAARELGEASHVLKEQAKGLNLAIDPEWDIDTLAAKVLDAQEAKALAEKAAYEAQRKTPVLLLRDAWPVADERHNAGEIINVPIDIAKKWFEAGVAVRADPLPTGE